MGKKSGPPPPDYSGLAKQQASDSKENLTQQDWANRADQTNPWGSVTWDSRQEVDPSTGQKVTKWDQNTTLDPNLQHALDSQMNLESGRSDLAGTLFPRVQQEFGKPMDFSGLTPWAGGGGMQAGGAQAYTDPFGYGGRQTTSAYGGGPQGAGQGMQRTLDFGGTQAVQGADQNRSRAENAIYQSATSRLDPQWQQRQDQMTAQLANQGITQGSAAYTHAMDDFSRQRNDAYQQANMGAITGGGVEAQRNQGMDLGLRQQQVGEIGQEGQFQNAAQQQGYGQQLSAQQARLSQQQQAFGQQQALEQGDLQQQQQAFSQQQAAGGQNFQQQLQQAQFQNSQRQQQLTEAMQQRGFSLNEINALLQGQQVSMPQFSGYSQSGLGQGADLMGAAQQNYGAQQQKFAQQQAQTGQYLGAAAGIASAAFAFSDRRLKADLRRVGRHARGFGIYTYRFIGERGRRVGVIAQEVRRFAPELVRSAGGTLQVNYGGL